MNPGRLLAWVNLAWNFARHVTTQLPLRLAGRSSGARRFREAVLPEGYVPLDAAERDAMPRFMSCIHCGLCSIASRDPDAPGAWDDAWTFVAGASRSIDRAKIAVASVSRSVMSDAGARVCPTGVPIPFMAATIQRLASTVPDGDQS